MPFQIKRKVMSNRRIVALLLVLCVFYLATFYQTKETVDGKEQSRGGTGILMSEIDKENENEINEQVNEEDKREMNKEQEQNERVKQDIHLGAELVERNKTHEEKKRGFPYNVLLLASMGRSGSSFLGGLLYSQSNAGYIFEPLHDIEAKNLLTEQSAVDGLRDIFTCDIKDPILSALMRNPKFFLKGFYMECGIQKSCLTRESINWKCRQKSVRVVKTIRTRVRWLGPLLHDPEVNLKVIHLVRDPRASIISGWARGWNLSANRACELLADDLQNGLELKTLHPEKYLAVRYEDLCDDPWGLAEKIFTFLGYSSLPASTTGFLKTSTTSGDRKGAYSINRNTKKMPQKWRSAITGDQLRLIETACESTISEIGFRLFRDLKVVQNLSVPLYGERYDNHLFLHDDAT